MSLKVLVVDDEKPIADILKFNLEKEGYEVIVAHDGDDAIELAEKEDPDLILLDIMLPGKDGNEVCREVRKTKTMPIIMLTAKDDEIDKVLGLELGADDYVTKPFSNRELIARVKANLRRQQEIAKEPETTNKDIVIRNITIHPDAYSVSKEGVHIDLTHREFELFYYLARHIGQVMTREDLLETVWGYDYFGDVRTVDVTVRRLREKIEEDPSNPMWIVTRRGVGYYLRQPEEEEVSMKMVGFLRSIQLKFIIIYILLLVIAVQVIGSYVARELETELMDNFKESVNDRVDLLSYNIEEEFEKDRDDDDDEPTLQEAIQDVVNDVDRSNATNIRVVNEQGQVLGTNDYLDKEIIGKKLTEPIVQNALKFKTSTDNTLLNNKTGNRVFVLVEPIIDSEGDVEGAIYLETSVESVYGQIQGINEIFLKG